MDYNWLESTSNVQTLSPQFGANLTFGFAQSLLRDFGREVSTTGLRVAEKEGEIAENNLFRTVTQLIQQVEEMYWALAFLRQDLDGKRRSLEVAEELLVQNEELFQAGRVAAVSVLQANAGVAGREQEVITAESEVERFEDRLKSLLWLDLATTNLTPTDEPALEPADIDERASLQTALQVRPEIRSLETEREQREIELNFASNQTLPRLDLALQYTLSGLSGRPNATCLDPTSPVCVPVGAQVGDTVFADRTGSLEAVTSLFSRNPFEGWSVELSFEIPLHNRTADARYASARLQLLETDTRIRAIYDQIQEEIRNAIRETQTAEKRVDAARETITFLEDQLEGMRSQLEAGLASSYDVLQVLDELDVARTTELRAVMDFNVGLSRVRLADASSLERYNIELERPPRYVFE
jgi:outer membrane protein TolC